VRARLTQFVQQLRGEGLRISIAETLDAMAAVKRAGVDPVVLRESLAATLVKDELDRERFDAAFEAFFGPPPRSSEKRGRRGPAAGDPSAASGGRSGGSGAGGGGAPKPPPEATPAVQPVPPSRPGQPSAPTPTDRPAPATERRATPSARAATDREKKDVAGRAAAEREAPRRTGDDSRAASERARAGRGSDRREILRKPLTELTPGELDEAAELARELGRRFAARASRRERRQRTGRIDVRRTIRSSLGRGGAMIVLERRGRRPGKPRLVVLCDVSGSVARASELLLSIVAAAETAFQRVTRFAYVDRLVPIAFEGGHVLPEGELDLWARSDFGAVLRELEERFAERLDRSTVVLVLGDARNNRRPPRADVLRRLARRARAVVFAVPEPRARWNTGDSALAAYATACDLVVEATTLEGLLRAVRDVARR